MEKTLFTVTDGVGVITLNDAGRLNPLDPAMDDELVVRLSACEVDKRVKVVVLAGAGKSFSAGGDMNYFKQQLDAHNYEALDSLVRHVNRLILKVRTLRKLVIAAVQGYAVGGGATLALAADFVVGDETTKFQFPFTNIGLTPDAGAMYLLSRCVGATKAMQLCTDCNVVQADEAVALGMMQRCVPAGQAMEAATAWARELAAGPVLAYQLLKEENNRINYADFKEFLFSTEPELVYHSYRSHDYREAVTAFLEKRKPAYKGC